MYREAPHVWPVSCGTRQSRTGPEACSDVVEHHVSDCDVDVGELWVCWIILLRYSPFPGQLGTRWGQLLSNAERDDARGLMRE
jgi:hypothetical protein